MAKKELTELKKIIKEIKRDRVNYIHVKLGTSESSPESAEYVVIDNPDDVGCLLIMEDRSRIPARGMEFADAADAIFNTATNENRSCNISAVYYENYPHKEVFDQIFGATIN